MGQTKEFDDLFPHPIPGTGAAAAAARLDKFLLTLYRIKKTIFLAIIDTHRSGFESNFASFLSGKYNSGPEKFSDEFLIRRESV